MKTAVILHGTCSEDEYFKIDFPSPSNSHWLPWLQQKFLRSDILCQTLEMPAPYNPTYQSWKKTFEQLNTEELSIIVAHSAGSGFILKWLQENPQIKLEKLILVAPWLDPNNTFTNFLNFELSKSTLQNTKEIHLLLSADDKSEIQISSQKIMQTYPQINLHTFEDKGHFCFSDIGNTFDELWDLCK